ncbi:hypothetical protein [Absidia glauca]|uniref:GATA-type domain-containing protein n=1 Tax=Absidia glauca TaxID=4829 RepID=A0A163KLT4_ABSGL|nr:hypothetical protein [Absidia glauca]
MSSCFWALLSSPDYEFLYLPTLIMNTTVDHHSIKELLLGRPFIDLIHPDERPLAKSDFDKFTDLNILAGAVTRLRKLDCIARYNKHDRGNDLDWIIVDVIMYTAAENVVLAFFHCDQGYPACPHALCDYEKETEIDGMACLPPLFQRYHDNFHTNGHVSSHQEQTIGTLRAFQLYNNVTRNIVMTWPTKEHLPSHYNNIVDAIHDDFYHAIQHQRDHHPSSPRYEPNTPCTHHTRSTSNLILEGHGSLRFEKILIQYGQWTFAVFKIFSPPPSSTQPPSPVDLSSSYSRISSPSPSSGSSSYSPTLPSSYLPQTSENDKRRSPPKSWRIRPHEKKLCESCHTSQSPEWRRGPSGHRTLCNACGLRYSRSLARQEQRVSPILSPAEDRSPKYPGHQRRFFNLYP